MTENNFPAWQALFLNAIREPLDSPQLPQVVKEAEVAMSQRLQELRASANGNEERQALAEALPGLRYVRIQKFRHSAACSPHQLGAQ
jgi:hypothetical protein